MDEIDPLLAASDELRPKFWPVNRDYHARSCHSSNGVLKDPSVHPIVYTPTFFFVVVCFDLFKPICFLVNLFWFQDTGIILAMGSANERRRYNVTSSLIGWAHTENDP